ncbi:MAG: DUF5790 family protein [Halobacteriales archaeon]
MGQTSLDDDDLFGEAAEDLRGDIETSLAEARSVLPDPDAIWEIEADNVVGVLNGLRGAMDAEGAERHLRDAKKWYTMGERADAFEDPEAIEAEIEAVADLVEQLSEAREQISDLAGTVPELRGALQDAREGGADGDEGADVTAGAGDAPEAEADGGDPQADQASLDVE